MEILRYLAEGDYEQVVFGVDRAAGLRAIIAVHDTTLGPALGGVLNDDTIPRLRCAIVCGAANNQLLEDRHGDALAARGILYAPDYVANAGGITNLSTELTKAGYNADLARARTARIFDVMQRVIAAAKAEGTTTAAAADRLAEARIAAIRGVRRLYFRTA